MEKRVIKTRLVHKEEVFRLLAVAEATGFPILLIGPPGIAKTNCLLDYGAAKFNNNHDEVLKNSFILETDEGTKSAEIKGRIDLEQLVQHDKYHVTSPITSAKYVLINEVDKASSTLRNSMLSCMNEKILFNGKEQIPLEWDIFCASCNEIPADETGSPFWDRFVIKVKMNRLNKVQLSKIYGSNIDLQVQDVHIDVPTKAELRQLKPDVDKLEKFVTVTYEHLSDRTMTYVPDIVRAVSIVYRIPFNRALVKTCEILTTLTLSKTLSQQIEPAELIKLRAQIETLSGLSSETTLRTETDKIQHTMEALYKKGTVTDADIDSLKEEVETALNNNIYIQQESTTEMDGRSSELGINNAVI